MKLHTGVEKKKKKTALLAVCLCAARRHTCIDKLLLHGVYSL